MKLKENKRFRGIFEVELSPFADHRGYHMRTFDEQLFLDFGIPVHWEQENHSMNIIKGTVRGLHFILPPHTDAKLIRCIRGKVFDVFVDLRKGSPTQGEWEAILLSEDEFRWIFIPKGFAHGFCSLTDRSELLYKHDVAYRKDFECGIRWDDPVINISWPCSGPVVSEKDKSLMSYSEFITKYGGL
jgi:dTDP-4-dehydrorhamnose 3,5-epimerase